MQPDQQIFETLFNRDFSDPGNKNFLEELAAAHPYFSPAQFFLLRQIAEGTEAFEKQAAKTNIFFNNPHWLNFQLQQSKQGNQPAAYPTAEVPVELPVDTTEEENLIAEEEQSTTTVVHMINITEEENEMQSADNTGSEENSFTIETAEPIEPVVQAEDNTNGEPEMEKEIEPMKIELKIAEEKNSNGNDMLFEPMHLVDYFASQGIRLSEEIQSTDKLGRQLKSFTEWLKTMKKVHAAESDQTDKTVESLAEISNIENEVLTEAMAEVFARQGKTLKATELYQKLSLLNPAKSAYFAAKIENLKGV